MELRERSARLSQGRGTRRGRNGSWEVKTITYRGKHAMWLGELFCFTCTSMHTHCPEAGNPRSPRERQKQGERKTRSTLK